ncbi:MULTISPECIES: hypothetical protein [Xanthomonas]|uniref:Uncharacterized protein n=1 Tax=Xanthomonas euvesicatoria TaxID=456327 RepID=A0AAW3U214_XANEU|nr:MULTISPECIES: hypothetical protein [Xanthomonas]MBB4722644.1 hypothetical protein [Xanthomonas euvesicatoria]MBB4869237.1 hypothetical protein [Xanthomonas euvesicatoria]NIK19497.1 hypothetical protein [Xanthomonas cannabis]
MTEQKTPAAEKQKTATAPAKTYPNVTQKGNVTVTEYADGTTHYNALGTTK